MNVGKRRRASSSVRVPPLLSIPLRSCFPLPSRSATSSVMGNENYIVHILAFLSCECFLGRETLKVVNRHWRLAIHHTEMAIREPTVEELGKVGLKIYTALRVFGDKIRHVHVHKYLTPFFQLTKLRSVTVSPPPPISTSAAVLIESLEALLMQNPQLVRFRCEPFYGSLGSQFGRLETPLLNRPNARFNGRGIGTCSGCRAQRFLPHVPFTCHQDDCTQQGIDRFCYDCKPQQSSHCIACRSSLHLPARGCSLSALDISAICHYCAIATTGLCSACRRRIAIRQCPLCLKFACETHQRKCQTLECALDYVVCVNCTPKSHADFGHCAGRTRDGFSSRIIVCDFDARVELPT